MTMILQLLVAAVAVGLTVAEPPEYKQNLTALREAADIIQSNILSMEGNIPLLNDSRRHYAEIVHVIYYDGVLNSGCVAYPYYETYQTLLNRTAPEVNNNPEIVIDEMKDLFATVDNKTSELRELIDACVEDDDFCNEFIDFLNPDQYSCQVLLAAGNVANELKKRNSKFEEVSRDLEAHRFVIISPQYLKDIVDAVSQLFRTLHPQW